MADSAILIPINLSANTYTTLYTVPANKRAVVNINICNTTTTDTTYFLSFVPSGGNLTAPTSFVEYSKTIKAAGAGYSDSTNLRTGEMLPAGASVVAKAVASGVCITVSGAEGN